MILAPIDGREFSAACRGRRANPAICKVPQLLRLLAIVTIAGLFLTVALSPDRAKAADLPPFPSAAGHSAAA